MERLRLVTLFDMRVRFQIVKFQLPGARGNLSGTHKIKIKQPIHAPAHLGSRKEHSQPRPLNSSHLKSSMFIITRKEKGVRSHSAKEQVLF